MKQTISVTIDGQTQEVQPGISLMSHLGRAVVRKQRIIAACFNNHLVGLETAINGEVAITTLRSDEPAGKFILHRTATHMLQSAAVACCPELLFSVGQTIGEGIFYEVHGPDRLDLHQLVKKLNQEMQALIEKDQPFSYRQIPVDTASAVLTCHNNTKAELLEAWSNATVPIVELNGFVDIQHGPFAPSTGFAEGVRVRVYDPGIILLFPGAKKASSPDGRRIWECYRETRDWNRAVGIETVGQLNRAILDDRIREVVHVAEALHEKKVVEIADSIAKRKDTLRVVSVAGPSSAGKTTFVKRLSVQLQVHGLQPLVINLDDYYRDRSQCPKDEDGNLDFEALEALEVELIQDHLQSLIKGQTVFIPRFDFVSGVRTPAHTWRQVRLAGNQVLIMEGIHGINPALIQHLPEGTAFRIYLNALTQLVIDEHNRIYTSDTRLLRRIVRDRRYRGTSAADTIARWPSVRKGEYRYIFPFQHEPEVMFNSALVYEVPVLKTFVWRYLLEVPTHHPSRMEANRLLAFLQLFVPVFPDDVPANSVLREFIGGSGFSY
jgi:uridine kinase